MTTTLQRRESASLWEQFCQWVTSTETASTLAGSAC